MLPRISRPGILKAMPQTGRAGPPKRGRIVPSPSARPRISPSVVSGYRRRRILYAFAALCSEQGYEATTISDLAKGAAVARKSIYDNFDGKEGVLLAAFDFGREQIAQRIEAACAEADGEWGERVEAGLGALLAFVAEQPDLAWLCVFEARGATAAGAERYERALDGFAATVREAAPEGTSLAEPTLDALLGGVVWVIQRQLGGGEEESVEDLLPELVEFALMPYRRAGAV
jgi:AcrR family transcriptional regulator